MVRTIKQFWDDMKAELGLEETLTSYELICKMWRKRALTAEKQLATAVEALELFGDSMDMNTAEVAQEVLAEIRGEQDD
ncbi:hypothetical protein [Lactococcus garvieae]